MFMSILAIAGLTLMLLAVLAAWLWWLTQVDTCTAVIFSHGWADLIGFLLQVLLEAIIALLSSAGK